MNMRTKSLRSILVVAVATLTMTAGMTTANAAPNDKPNVLVFYVENRSLVQVDSNEQGIGNGDLFHRELAIAKKINGPVIGVSYSQAEIVSNNPEKNADIRRVLIQNMLPKGESYFLGLTQIDRGNLPPPGWTDTYAIVGGTGMYAGARGTMNLELLADRKSWKSTMTYTLN